MGLSDRLDASGGPYETFCSKFSILAIDCNWLFCCYYWVSTATGASDGAGCAVYRGPTPGVSARVHAGVLRGAFEGS